jgi:hypothetical protein
MHTIFAGGAKRRLLFYIAKKKERSEFSVFIIYCSCRTPACYFRCRHGKNPLTWQSITYGHAKAWAATCTYAHSGPSGFENGGAGENLATSSYPQTHAPEDATERWYSEVTSAAGGAGYLPGTASNDARYGESGGADQVGHYTAMIWGATTHLVSLLQRTRVIWGPTTHLVHSWSQAVQSNAIRI